MSQTENPQSAGAAGLAASQAASSSAPADAPQESLVDEALDLAKNGLAVIEHGAVNLTLAQAVGLVGTIASAVVPGASLLGMSLGALTKLGVGVANEVPDALAAYSEMQSQASSGLPATPEQVAAWNAAADDAHAAVQAAADKVLAGDGP